MKTFILFLVLLMVSLNGLAPGVQAQTCTAPANISVTSPTTTTAVVSFTPVATATSYTVRYFWSGDSTAAGTFTLNTTTSPVTLTGLRTASYYVVYVTSNCANGGTATSGWHVFQTSGGGTVGCGNISTTFITAGTTTYIGFTPIAGALSYTVRYHAVGDTLIHTTTVTGSPISLAGLLPGTGYVANVVTNCASGSSSTGINISFTTMATPNTSCALVTNVRAYPTMATPTTATLSFTPVVGALSYTIRYYAANSSAVQTVTVTGSPVTLTGLQPGSFYNGNIYTNCASGVSATSAPATFATITTSNCGAVTNVTVTATSSSTATVNFTPGAGNSSFHVICSVPGDSASYQYVTSTTAPVLLTGLIPGRTYTISVGGICGVSGQLTTSSSGPVVFSFRGALASRAALGAGTFEAYPNPAHRTASLVLPAVAGAAKAQVLLLNAVGQQVRVLAVPLSAGSETRTQLDLSGVAPGLYTLRVLAGSQAASQRLVVK